MKKTIKIEEKEIHLKTNALQPLKYQKEFKRDFFADAYNIASRKYELEPILYLLWIFAKEASDEIPDSVEEWLAEFENFPIIDYIPTVVELLTLSLLTHKKDEKSEETSKKKKNS